MAEYLPIQAGLETLLLAICPTFNRFAQIVSDRPYCCYKRTGTSRDVTFKGNNGIATARVQVSVFGDTPQSATRTANTIRLAMLNIRNTTWGDHLVFGCKLEDQLEGEEPNISSNGEVGLYSEILDFLITYSEQGAS